MLGIFSDDGFRLLNGFTLHMAQSLPETSMGLICPRLDGQCET